MRDQPITVSLPWTQSDRHRHVCAFFHSPEEEYTVMLPFIQEGVELGDKIWYIVDSELRTQHLRVLGQAGLDTDALRDSGRLDVASWAEAHLSPGHFDQNAMLSLLDGTLWSNAQQGFPITRIWSNQEWALKDLPGVGDIAQYESRWNTISAKHDVLTVCVYDISRFGGGIVMDMLRTHPFALVGGILYENPFYSTPEEFQLELSQRAATAALV
jgi:hypothetical protein